MHQNRREFLQTTTGIGMTLTLGGRRSVTQSTHAVDDLAYLSLSTVSERVRLRKISPSELTQTCLRRIERLNPVLNAFITVMAEQAIADAKTAEAELAKGKWRGPLHGIPIALKDLIDTAGVRTTAASAVFADRIPTEDAEVVRRLRVAGAVFLGKLNMHEFAYGDSSAPSHFGPVRNPWDTTRVPGGSSGGSAAAVAAGLCYAALGSDTGGSIRQPAGYCAIAGLKPTFGLVSTRGVVPLSWSLDHIGPMCRTVADVALALQPLAGHDSLDVNSIAATAPDYSRSLRQKVSSLRLGIPRKPFYDTLDPEIERAVGQALEALRMLTASSRDVELPPYSALPVVGAEAYAFHAPYLTKTPDLYKPMTRRRLEGGAQVTAAAYIAGRRELDRLRREVAAVFSEVDLLVTPTTPVMPATVEAALNDPGTPPPGGVARSLRNTQPFDIYGLPTISIPCVSVRPGSRSGCRSPARALARGPFWRWHMPTSR